MPCLRAGFLLQSVIARVARAAQIEDGLEALRRRSGRSAFGEGWLARAILPSSIQWKLRERGPQEAVVGPDQVMLGAPAALGRGEVETGGLAGSARRHLILMGVCSGAVGRARPRIRSVRRSSKAARPVGIHAQTPARQPRRSSSCSGGPSAATCCSWASPRAGARSTARRSSRSGAASAKADRLHLARALYAGAQALAVRAGRAKAREMPDLAVARGRHRRARFARTVGAEVDPRLGGQGRASARAALKRSGP